MLYFFYGENTRAAKSQITKLIQRYLVSTGSDFGLHRFNHESQPDAVITALGMQAMFADASLVIIEDPSRNKSLWDKLLINLEQIPASTVAVIYDPSIDKRTTWFKTLQKLAKTTEFKPKSETQLLNFVQAQAADNGYELDRATAKFLLEWVGADEWRLLSEINKLASADGPITSELIQQLVQPSQEQSVFVLLEALTRGDSEAALGYFQTLIAQGVHELEILTMIGWQLRNLLIVKSAGSRSDQDIAKDHGMNPYVIRKVRQAARTITDAGLEQSYREVIETDYQIKSSGHDSAALVEGALLRIGGWLKR